MVRALSPPRNMSTPFVLQPWDTPCDDISLGVRVSDFVVQPTSIWRAVFCQRPWLSLNSPAQHFCLQEEKEGAPLLEAICLISSPLWLANPIYLDVPRFGFWAPVPDTVKRDISDLISTTQDALSGGSFSRVFYLNEHGELRKNGETALSQLRLSNQGWGTWSLPAEVKFSVPYFSSRGFEFYWEPNDSKRFLDVSSPDLLSDFSVQLADEESDAAFALRLAKEKFSDFNAHIWSWKNGDLKTFFEVLTLAFVSENDFWETRKNFCWQIQLPGAEISALNGGQAFRIGKNPNLRDSSPQLQEAYKRVLDWFAPTLNEEVLERHLCLARHYTGQGGSWDYRKPFFMSIQNPTEARRQKLVERWRKWLDMTS